MKKNFPLLSSLPCIISNMRLLTFRTYNIPKPDHVSRFCWWWIFVLYAAVYLISSLLSSFLCSSMFEEEQPSAPLASKSLYYIFHLRKSILYKKFSSFDLFTMRSLTLCCGKNFLFCWMKMQNKQASKEGGMQRKRK